MSDQQENEVPVPEFVAGIEEVRKVLPGALLAAQRQAKGWSVEHVASQLKFASRQVAALEADNYAALPGPVIVRGFVRAYAKLLGMDSNSLVADLPQDGIAPAKTITPQRTLSTPFSESPLPLGNRKNIPIGMVVGGVLLVMVAASVVVIQRTSLFEGVSQLAWLKSGAKSSGAQEEIPAQTQIQADQADPAELPPEVQDGTEKNKPSDPIVVKSGSAESAAAKMTSEPPAPAVASAAVTAATVTAQPSAPVRDSATKDVKAAPSPISSVTGNLNVSKSKDLLRLNFREDSWVEIRRADKTTVISRLLKAGTSETFDITEPMTLVVGNAAGVDASLRGAKLDLEADSSSNVARLSLK